jgi:lysophospholipase L1-like esterase
VSGATHFCRLALCLVAWGMLSRAVAAESSPSGSPWSFTLKDGDRVILLGGTFIEREQSNGYLESALTSRFPGRKIEFRNLGWSGDNVFGEARAGFGTVDDGFAHLKQHVLATRPTVVVLNYGANESFEGQAGLANFRAGLDKLLAMLDETKAHLVFLGPPPQEDLGRPLPDPAAHNRDLKRYGAAVAAAAAGRGEPMVDLFELLGKKLDPPGRELLTDNGIHLSDYGYWRAAPVIERALGLPPRRWLIEIDAERGNVAARGTTVSGASISPREIRFQALDAVLPLAPPPVAAPTIDAVEPRIVRVFGLAAGGKYTLASGDEALVTGTAQQFAAGVRLPTTAEDARAEQLRQAIVDKNRLYFYRWRPQNETYLLGFRKHEQGNNAVEIPRFDPLVEQQEAAIRSLAVPVARPYRITHANAK